MTFWGKPKTRYVTRQATDTVGIEIRVAPEPDYASYKLVNTNGSQSSEVIPKLDLECITEMVTGRVFRDLDDQL